MSRHLYHPHVHCVGLVQHEPLPRSCALDAHPMSQVHTSHASVDTVTNITHQKTQTRVIAHCSDGVLPFLHS
jgi:hypothetical protein